MIHSVRSKLQELCKNIWFVVSCVGAVIALLVILGLTFGNSHGHHAAKVVSSPVAKTSLLADTSTNPPAGSAPASTPMPASTNHEGSPSTASGKPATTVTKITINDDGTTTKEIASYNSIPFSSEMQDDHNLRRGTTHVQAGENGIERIVYSVIYDPNGKELSRKTISDTVTKQPLDQITKVGTSDYNLNTDTWDGTEFGEMCLPADYDSAGDGCVGVPSDQRFGAVSVDGTFYVSCVSSTNGVCNSGSTVNVQPIIAIQSDGTFSYQGATYRADPRAGGGEPQLLTPSICTQYGLACGSW